MGVKLKSIRPVYENRRGVCVWMMPDNSVFGDEEGNFLSMEGNLNDPVVEIKMQKAAVYWGGEEALLGHAKWIPGSRQVSEGEHDEHTERLLNGRVPDPIDEARQVLLRK